MPMKAYTFILAILLAGLTVLPSFADELPKPSKLTAREQKDVHRIEIYLNNLKSVSADFLQVSDEGMLRYGSIAIKRPGKMRVTYNPPSEDFMVADGSFLHMWDADMKSQTSVPVSSGIASFILEKNIKFSSDVILTRFVRYPAKIEIDLVSKETPEEGELTLIFEDNPLKLRQWRILDTQGHTTGINLENSRENVDFPSDTFIFMAPTFGKSG
ncbi:MAG TPA: outer membrane lipoprotein carrier protein LolA [Rhodospirillaceae bacterium]|nr:outer membrane lipoprotein carrier protein LolA [Rhodospirillaceae bacterium]